MSKKNTSTRKTYTKRQKQLLINQVIKKKNDNPHMSVLSILNGLNIAAGTFYNWLKMDELAHYKEQLDEAEIDATINDVKLTNFLAKKSLNELISGYESKKIIKKYNYKYDEDGKLISKVLTGEIEEITNIPPDPKLITFVLERVNQNFKENEIEYMLRSFLSFGEWLRDVDPVLSKKFTSLQNSYMNSRAKDLDFKEIKK